MMLLDSMPVVRYPTTPYHTMGWVMRATISPIQKYCQESVFRATPLDGYAVVVKFARHYGEAAHQKAFTHNVAPQIISSEWIYDWCMVVMDDASGSYETLCDAQIEYFTMRSRPPKERQGDAGATELPYISLPRLSFSFAVIRRAMISAHKTVLFQDCTSRDLSERINAP